MHGAVGNEQTSTVQPVALRGGSPGRLDRHAVEALAGEAPPERGMPMTAFDAIGGGRLLTPEDVAELLQVDRETVYRMARRGELPAIKVARHWRLRAARIERWLRELEDGER